MYELLSSEDRVELLDSIAPRLLEEYNLGKVTLFYLENKKLMKDLLLDVMVDAIEARFSDFSSAMSSESCALSLAGNNARTIRRSRFSSAFASLWIGDVVISSWYDKCFAAASDDLDQIVDDAAKREGMREEF